MSSFFPITREILPAKICIGLLHTGPFHEIGPIFQQFYQQQSQLSDETKQVIEGQKVLGLYRSSDDDDESGRKAFAAVELKTEADAQLTGWSGEWQRIRVNGGPAAVMTVTGSYDTELPKAWESFAPRVAQEFPAWKLLSHTNANDTYAQEIYVSMDMKDMSKCVTKLIMFLEDEQ